MPKKRGPAESSPGPGSVEEQAERRRRIAGERPRPAGSDDADGPAEDSDEIDDSDEADASDSDDTPAESRTLAQSATALDPKRARMIAAATALAIGAVVGVVLTALVYAGMQAFQAIYHTPAGDGVGAVLLVVVLVIAVLTGRWLLRLRGLPDPNATTLLGMMLIAIVTLGLLLPIVFSVWMLVITPVLGALSYLGAHLIIARFA